MQQYTNESKNNHKDNNFFTTLRSTMYQVYVNQCIYAYVKLIRKRPSSKYELVGVQYTNEST